MPETNKSTRRYLRHGILGRYCSSNNPGPSHDSSQEPGRALQTSLAMTTAHGEGFELATTGTAQEIAGQGQVIIAGQPYFRDPQLTQLAQDQGSAAAVAHAYTEHGDAVFSLIHGSFCCAIIDTSKERVLVGIDRLGQHSLYYRATDNTLAFGSSASSALASDRSDPVLSNQGIYNYLYFHMVPCPDSVYAGLKKLQAAHYLEYSKGELQLRNYWQPNFSENTSEQSFDALASQLKESLQDAVRNCLPSEGKVGAFLSGGLDSSTVTGVLSEVSEQRGEAYSIGFSAEGYDEMAFARITAKHFGVELNEYYVTPQDVVDALPMIATSYDEPFGNSSALPAYFCAKMAMENGVQTLLAGDGGDEIFAGNERYLRQNVFEHYSKVPAFLRKGLLEPLISALPTALPLVSKAGSYIDQANTPLPERLQSYNFLHRHAASEIFSDEFLRDVNIDLPIAVQRDIYHRPPQATDLNRMLYLDWQNTLADNDLRKVSHMCGLAGVDVVYPMLDDALVDFSCKVPSAWKMKGNDLRHFFKQSLQGWLPDETINKSKQGFGLPFGVWMQTYQPLREMAYDNMLKLKSRGFVRADFIDRAIEMHQSEHAAYYGELVWIFTVFELWMEAHSNSAP
ncbi:MAG: asparagine synthase (glutamine-hydrolyzing) [Halioglobus sp.]|jgi:asparagine synthase (glutamine-hydrolysing)